jgi:hypothetical protein
MIAGSANQVDMAGAARVAIDPDSHGNVLSSLAGQSRPIIQVRSPQAGSSEIVTLRICMTFQIALAFVRPFPFVDAALDWWPFSALERSLKAMRRLSLVIVFLLVTAGALGLLVAINMLISPTILAPASQVGDIPKPLRP